MKRSTITTVIGMFASSLVVLTACNGGVDYGEAANAGSAGEAGAAGSSGAAGSDAGTGGSDAGVCDPGSSKACKCGDESGTKKCKDDGSGYDECKCEAKDGGTDASPICDPGIYKPCKCGELDGNMRCLDDGSGFGECKCEAGPDASVCTPGEYKTTGCCGNGIGTQQCKQDGSGWGDCLYCEQPDAGPTKCGQYDVGTIVTSPCCPGGTNGKQVCQANGVMSECMDCPPPATHTHYHDSDGDGAGDPNDKIVDTNANPPAGYVNVDGDCDDNDPTVVPGSIRSCVCSGGGNGTQQCVNGAWTSCTGCQTTQYTHFRDADGDGLGDPANKLVNTSPTPPAGYVTNPNDCDDTNAAVGITGNRSCVGAGNCTGMQQCANGVWGTCTCSGSYTHYRDADGDQHGNPNDKIVDSSANPPSGYVNVGDDCDDTNPAVTTSGSKSCIGAGNCSGTQQCTNGAYGACVCSQMFTYYPDADNDNYVSDTGSITVASSTPPAGYKVRTSSNGGDCMDNDPAVHPGAVEVCDNNKDDNCDGNFNEGCQDGGETTDTVTVVFSDNTDWSVPVIKGRWNGRTEIQENGGTTDWYAFTGCTKPSAHAVTCTFTVPHIAIGSLIFQVNLGSNRYWGDASGNAPAPCKTPSEMAGIYQSSVTMIGTLILKVNGVLQPFHMCANGTPKQSSCAGCCASSGSMPYYNGMNGECQ